MLYSSHRTVLTPSDSGLTSAAYLVQDWSQMAFQTSDTSIEVHGTLVHGAGAALATADWSTLTTAVAAGLYTLEPGPRYVRFVRNASTTTILLAGRR